MRYTIAILLTAIAVALPVDTVFARDPYFNPPGSEIVAKTPCLTVTKRATGRACYGGPRGQAYLLQVEQTGGPDRRNDSPFRRPAEEEPATAACPGIFICYTGSVGREKIFVTPSHTYQLCEPKDLSDCSTTAIR
jgi:hypothetical protein